MAITNNPTALGRSSGDLTPSRLNFEGFSHSVPLCVSDAEVLTLNPAKTCPLEREAPGLRSLSQTFGPLLLCQWCHYCAFSGYGAVIPVWSADCHATMVPETRLCHDFNFLSCLQADKGTLCVAKPAQQWANSQGIQWTSHGLQHR